jgi:predicted RNase H-like nuclease
MTVILAVDAAWTINEPSGVALVAKKDGVWRALCVAPSYDAFVSCSGYTAIDWEAGNFLGSMPDFHLLLAAARTMSSTVVDLIVVDMPLSTVPIAGRRVADNSISLSFGAFGCATHSPTSERPGRLSADVVRQLHNLGFPLATLADNCGTLRGVIETYPHPALLKLLRCDYRVPYKVSKSRRYWPNMDIRARIKMLLAEFTRIYQALSKTFGDSGLDLPCASKVQTLAALKRYEDALDALVCAWVGVMYVEERAKPYGDSRAAIWVPI